MLPYFLSLIDPLIIGALIAAYPIRHETEGQFALDHRRVSISSTRNGFGLAVLLLVQLVIASHFNNNLIFVLAYFIIAVILLGGIYSFRNLSGLVVRT